MGLGGVSANINFPTIEKSELEKKLTKLKEPFLESFNPTLEERIERIKKVKLIIEDNTKDFHAALTKDFGARHPQLSLISDTLPIISSANVIIKNLKKWMRPEKRNIKFPGNLLGATAQIQYQPLGVVGIISPWNFPIVLSVGPLLEVLGAGNNAMLKLSEFVPETSKLIENLFNEKFNENEICVINGGPEVSSSFAELPFDHIIFTGSTSTAKLVAEAAAKNLVPVTLELGGKSPAILGKNANIKKSATKIMFGKLANAGQICMAPDYLFVPEGQEQNFIKEAEIFVKKYFNSLVENSAYTSVIHQGHYDRIQNYIQDAKDKGAKIIEINPNNEDFSKQDHLKIPPTLILNATDDMLISQNEIFGPVLPIKNYKELKEVTRYINNNQKPLAIYYFGNKKNDVEELLNDTTSGQMVVNEVALQFMELDMPFGGVGHSGTGSYHGKDGFINFSHKRSVMKGQNLISPIDLVGPPYNEKTEIMIKKLS